MLSFATLQQANIFLNYFCAKEITMSVSSNCPECESGNLYMSNEVPAGSLDGPYFLPDLGGSWSLAKFNVVVCHDCGLTRFFAAKEALANLPNSAKWRKLNSSS
jgi:predicted nucleic-acid-binding Zn-ribbon protein